jgi:nitrous oxide reductase accessory protein NosL
VRTSKKSRRGVTGSVIKAAVWSAVFFFAFSLQPSAFGQAPPAAPGKKDKCPVCGMFVAKYPDWLAQISFHDGAVYFFDGAKDLFKFYFNLKKYQPKRSASEIAAVFVTEYYDLEPIAAKSAWFVIGSDVFGPMGRELIPFKTKDAAAGFLKDHGGIQVLEFEQVTPAVIEKLD